MSNTLAKFSHCFWELVDGFEYFKYTILIFKLGFYPFFFFFFTETIHLLFIFLATLQRLIPPTQSWKKRQLWTFLSGSVWKSGESAQYFNLTYIIGCTLLDLLFIRLRKLPSSSSLLRFFKILLWMSMKFYQNTFSESIEMIICVSFILVMWWISLIDFWMLNQSCIPAVNTLAGFDLFLLNFEFLHLSVTEIGL